MLHKKNTLFFIIQLHAEQNFEARLRVNQNYCSFARNTSVYYPDLYAVDGGGNWSTRKANYTDRERDY